MTNAHTVHIIGDIHGHLAKLRHLLTKANLIDDQGRWSGGKSTLCFVGDYVDRGPHGLGCLNLIIALQAQALDAGGEVVALLGNHDIGLLSAYTLEFTPSDGPGGNFRRDWLLSGGRSADLEGLRPAHIEWLQQRPVMQLVGDDLLVHADSVFYRGYGESPDEVNANVQEIVCGTDPEAWDYLLAQFADRLAFVDDAWTGHQGVPTALDFLDEFGGTRIIHGHTPITKMTRRVPSQVTEALVYAQGLCVNVDGGMYLGSPGLIFEA